MTVFLKRLVNQGCIVCLMCKKEFDLDFRGLTSFKHHYSLAHIHREHNTEEHRQKIKEGVKRRYREEKRIRESFINKV